MKQSLVFFILLFTLAACAEHPDDPDAASDMPQPQMLFTTNTPDLATPEARAAYGEQLSQLARPIYLLTTAQSLAAARQHAAAIINKAPAGHGRAAAEQLAAQALLSTWMGREEATPEFIAEQVAPLISHRSPTPSLIANALERLDGHWSKEEIAVAAGKAADAAIEAIGEESGCKGCSRQQIEERILGAEGRRGRLLQMQDGLKRLDSMTH